MDRWGVAGVVLVHSTASSTRARHHAISRTLEVIVSRESLFVSRDGRSCVRATEQEVAQILGSGVLPADALVWVPGRRCWCRAESLPGYRPHVVVAATPAPIAWNGSRLPPDALAPASPREVTDGFREIDVTDGDLPLDRRIVDGAAMGRWRDETVGDSPPETAALSRGTRRGTA